MTPIIAFNVNPSVFRGLVFQYDVEAIGRHILMLAEAAQRGDDATLRSFPHVGTLYRYERKRPGVRASLRRRVFARDGRVCRQCGSTTQLEIDHIHPVAWGGTDALDNLQVLCRPCNYRKGPRPGELPA